MACDYPDHPLITSDPPLDVLSEALAESPRVPHTGFLDEVICDVGFLCAEFFHPATDYYCPSSFAEDGCVFLGDDSPDLHYILVVADTVLGGDGVWWCLYEVVLCF